MEGRWAPSGKSRRSPLRPKLKRCVTLACASWEGSEWNKTPRDFDAPNARFRRLLSR
jgi:hypothetical protein